MQRIARSNGMVNISLPPTDKGVTLPCANGKKPILNAEYIARHCTMFQNKTTSRLVSSQTEIEKRVTKSLQTLRHRQLTLSHGHCKRQIRSHGTTTSNTGNCVSRMQGIENRCNEATPPLGSPETSVDSINSSFDLSLPSPCAPDSSSQEATAETSYTLQKHLQCLENFVDDEATCSSSDEEDDVAGILTKKKQDQKHLKRNSIKQRWERDRSHIGSQWAWLCHQITSINQKIFQLDSLLQSVPPKRTLQFVPHNPFSMPCMCETLNGKTSSPTKLGTNGEHPQQKTASKPLIPNGRPCACQIRQLILSNPSLVSQQMHVKDLLGYSLPVLLMEETSQTCARTREMRHAPRRKLFRSKKKGRTGSEADSERGVDPAHHPFLSQSTDLSSTLWLDKAIHQILQEHSYASLPLPKKRKTPTTYEHLPSHAVPAHVSSSLRLERSKSFSPSPTPLDISIERIGKGIPRKRSNTTSNTPSYSDDSAHVTTPTLPRKRRSVNTPQYDIDNIIIPYSMASSTRLEKLEYKEIITPKWQEKLLCRRGDENGVEESEEENISDAEFQVRHAKCEERERKRYLTFITGGSSTHSRKRPRPHNSSTPEPSNHHHTPSTSLEHDGELFLQILPYPPRKFPLSAKETHALEKPGPPPKKVAKYIPISDCYSSSPSPLPCAERNGTPQGHSSMTTPLSSPLTCLSPPSEIISNESPLSTSKWTVVQSTSTPTNHHPSSGLVLKLTKRA